MTTLYGGPLLAGLVLTTMTTVSWSAGAAAPDLKIKDLMPEFWAVQEEAATLQRADRILRRFREQLIEPNRDIYSKPEFRDAITDEGMASYLKEVTVDLPAMRALGTNLEPRARDIVARFKQQFPRFDARITIVFLPSLHCIDTQYTRILDQQTLLFGVDAIARYRGSNADLSVLLTHELFHTYHARLNAPLYRDEQAPLYVRIWTEGLAAFVSEQVYPEAPSAQIIGDGGSAADRAPALVGQVAGMIRGSLDSTSPADQDKFLTYTVATAGLPTRAGHLIGYEVVKALSATYSLNELTALRGGKLRNLVSRQLERMSADYVAGRGAPVVPAVQSSAAQNFAR